MKELLFSICFILSSYIKLSIDKFSMSVRHIVMILALFFFPPPFFTQTLSLLLSYFALTFPLLLISFSCSSFRYSLCLASRTCFPFSFD